MSTQNYNLNELAWEDDIDIEKLNQNFQVLDSQAGEMNSNISGIRNLMEHVASVVGTINASMATVGELSSVSGKLEGVSNQIQGIDYQANEANKDIKNSLYQIKDKIDRLPTSGGNVDLSSVNSDLSNIKKSIASVLADISALKKVVDTVNSAVAPLENVNSSISSSVKELQTSMSDAVSQLTSISSSLKSMSADYYILQSDYSSIRSELEDLVQSKQEDYAGMLGVKMNWQYLFAERIGDAKYPNAFKMSEFFSSIRTCAIADDGTITYACDSGFATDGSAGQVMVEIPFCFIEKYSPDPNTQIIAINEGEGILDPPINRCESVRNMETVTLNVNDLLKSSKEAQAKPTLPKYIYIGAYPASIYDTSDSKYLKNDEQVMNVQEDKLCSISGVLPASGKEQEFSAINMETLAQNRGECWHLITMGDFELLIDLLSIELAFGDPQQLIGEGNVNKVDDGVSNMAIVNGASGSVAWRGIHDLWGNMWCATMYNGMQGLPEASDDDFIRSSAVTATAQPELPTTYVYPESGYCRSALDFPDAQTTNDKEKSLHGDMVYYPQEAAKDDLITICFGGRWDSKDSAGIHARKFTTEVSGRDIGGRLIYVPTPESIQM